MAGDPDYTRKWSICRTFAASGACSWALCKYNHSLIDTTRIAALVGDVTNASFASSSTPLPAAAATAEQTFFLLEYTKYSLQSDSSLNADTGPTPWRMRLMGGGRAMLVSQGGTMSVQPAYPAKGQGQGAGVALVELEKRVFGCCATPDLTRPSLCRAFSDGACKWGASCRFSHSLFSTDRIERLLERAVEEGGYKDFKPICEVEYVGRRDSTRPLSPVWRVTVRCVLGYHQKTAPQPIVVTSDNLNTAMRLLEGQFTRGSGKAPPPQGQAGPAGGSHRTRSKRPRAHTSSIPPVGTTGPSHTTADRAQPPVAERQPPVSPRRQPSPPLANSSNPPAAPFSSTGRRSPPPSYQDAVGGSRPDPSPADAKRRA